MSRCKKEGVKLNSAFELLSCLALRKLYELLGSSNEEFSNFAFHTIVSLRNGQRTGQDSFGEDVMGFISGGLINRPDTLAINRIIENKSQFSELFWPLAKKLSDEMHFRLKNDPSRFFVKINPAGKGEMNFHYSTSNLGIIFTSEESDLEYFRFDLPKISHFATYDKNSTDRLFYVWFASLLNEVCFGTHFNSHFVDIPIMEKYLNIFKDFLDQLIKNEPIQSNL